MKKIVDPLEGFALLQDSGETFFISNADNYGVEDTKTLEGKAKRYIDDLETGEPVNAIPVGDNDKSEYDHVTDPDFVPRYDSNPLKEESDGEEGGNDTPDTPEEP
jgi:hypothetical protein